MIILLVITIDLLTLPTCLLIGADARYATRMCARSLQENSLWLDMKGIIQKIYTIQFNYYL